MFNFILNILKPEKCPFCNNKLTKGDRFIIGDHKSAKYYYEYIPDRLYVYCKNRCVKYDYSKDNKLLISEYNTTKFCIFHFQHSYKNITVFPQISNKKYILPYFELEKYSLEEVDSKINKYILFS